MKEHQDIIAPAHNYARQILEHDPHLSDEKHARMRRHILSLSYALV